MIDQRALMIAPSDLLATGALVSSSIPEPAQGESEWSPVGEYGIGDYVVRSMTHKVYRRVIAGKTAQPPEQDCGEGKNWLEIGYSNRYRMFDQKIGSRSSALGSITLELDVPGSEGVAMFDIVGQKLTISKTVSATDPTIVFEKVISLDETIVEDVYDWMYAEFSQRETVVATDLPGQFYTGRVQVKLEGLTPTSTVSIGAITVGRVHRIGSMEYGAGVGLINFGNVSDDGFGNRAWEEGGFANRVKLPMVANRQDFARIKKLLAAYRSRPAVYIGIDLDDYSPLICYGVYRDLYITIPNHPFISFDIEIDGLSEG